MMDPNLRGSGGATNHLAQLGLSELDLLKLAASNGLSPADYTRSHSAEVQRAQQAAGATFAPSWPPGNYNVAADRDVAAATAALSRGMPQLSAAYVGQGVAGLAGQGLGSQQSLSNTADLSYLAQLGLAGTPQLSSSPVSAAAAAFGEGPRIYVGGVPDMVTVAMVRDHFSRWGVVRDVHFPKERTSRRRRHFCFVTFESMQAAERAVAESNREIGGYPVAAINIPTDRLTHYGLRQASQAAQLQAGLPLTPGSSAALTALGASSHYGLPVDAYGSSPTRSLSYGGAYNITHQIGANRIRGTTSADFGRADFLQQDVAAQLAAASEQDIAAALAALRMNQQANGSGSASGTSTHQTSQDFSVHSYSAGAQAGQTAQEAFPIGNLGSPATGSDVYTILANMRRNSAAAAAQRGSPQPSPRLPSIMGNESRAAVSATAQGSVPDGVHNSFPAQLCSRPNSALSQQNNVSNNSIHFSSQGGQVNSLSAHGRSISFDAVRPAQNAQQQPQEVQLGGSLRATSSGVGFQSPSVKVMPQAMAGKHAHLPPLSSSFQMASDVASAHQHQQLDPFHAANGNSLHASSLGSLMHRMNGNRHNFHHQGSEPAIYGFSGADESQLGGVGVPGSQAATADGTSTGGTQRSSLDALSETELPDGLPDGVGATQMTSAGSSGQFKHLEQQLNASVADLLSGTDGPYGSTGEGQHSQEQLPPTSDWQQWIGGDEVAMSRHATAARQLHDSNSPAVMRQQQAQQQQQWASPGTAAAFYSGDLLLARAS